MIFKINVFIQLFWKVIFGDNISLPLLIENSQSKLNIFWDILDSIERISPIHFFDRNTSCKQWSYFQVNWIFQTGFLFCTIIWICKYILFYQFWLHLYFMLIFWKSRGSVNMKWRSSPYFLWKILGIIWNIPCKTFNGTFLRKLFIYQNFKLFFQIFHLLILLCLKLPFFRKLFLSECQSFHQWPLVFLFFNIINDVVKNLTVISFFISKLFEGYFEQPLNCWMLELPLEAIHNEVPEKFFFDIIPL